MVLCIISEQANSPSARHLRCCQYSLDKKTDSVSPTDEQRIASVGAMSSCRSEKPSSRAKVFSWRLKVGYYVLAHLPCNPRLVSNQCTIKESESTLHLLFSVAQHDVHSSHDSKVNLKTCFHSHLFRYTELTLFLNRDTGNYHCYRYSQSKRKD